MPSLCAIEIHPLTALTHRAMVVWAVSFSEECAGEKRPAGCLARHFFIFMQKAPFMFSHESSSPSSSAKTLKMFRCDWYFFLVCEEH